MSLARRLSLLIQMKNRGSAEETHWKRPISHRRSSRQGCGRSSRFASLSRPAGAPLPRRSPCEGREAVSGTFSFRRSSQMRNLRSYPTQRRDHYQELTDKIIAALEAGVVAWRRPWDPTACGGSNMPVNVATDHRYRGVNLFLLSMSPLAFTSGDSRWCSYRQAAARGWQVRRGEKATPVYFYKPIEIEDKRRAVAPRTGESRCCERSRSFMLRKLMAFLLLRHRLRRRRSPSASRTRSSSLRRAACRFGLVVNAPFTTGRLTSSKCLRTKPFTVRNNEPSSSCTSSPTPAVIPRD
jgi:N-terminal domain of anti-restriction factor ArdC